LGNIHFWAIPFLEFSHLDNLASFEQFSILLILKILKHLAFKSYSHFSRFVMYTFTRKKNLFLIMILEKKKRIHGKYGRVLGKKNWTFTMDSHRFACDPLQFVIRLVPTKVVRRIDENFYRNFTGSYFYVIIAMK